MEQVIQVNPSEGKTNSVDVLINLLAVVVNKPLTERILY